MQAQVYTWEGTNLTITKSCPTKTRLGEQTSLLSIHTFSLPSLSPNLLYSSTMYSKLQEINLCTSLAAQHADFSAHHSSA